MRKKVNCIVLVVLLISTMFAPMSASAAENEVNEIPPDEVLIVGYHDIWRHSDGKTWQASGKPDTYQECVVKIAFQPKGKIESITAVYFPEKTALVGDSKYVCYNVSEMTFKTKEDNYYIYEVEVNPELSGRRDYRESYSIQRRS